MNEDYVIQTMGVGHSYSRKARVFHGLSLSIPRGSIYGLLGPNGSGKTTLIQLLLGVLRLGEGSCRVLGFDPTEEAVAIRSRVGYVPQKSDFDPKLSVAETLDFLRPFYGGRWSRESEVKNVRRFKLDAFWRLEIGKLSGGLVQRLALVAALATDPEILILDEPTAGLDAVVRRDFAEAVVEYMAGEGRTVLLSSHLLHEVERLADHVCILTRGGVVLEGPVDELKEHVTGLTFSYEGNLTPEIVREFAERKLALARPPCDGRWQITVWTHGDDDRSSLTERLAKAGAEDVSANDLDLESMFVGVVESRLRFVQPPQPGKELRDVPA